METQLTPEMIILIPVVAGIIQVLKKIPRIQPYKEFLPLVAIALGVLLVWSVPYLGFLKDGAIVGLGACGGYALLKSKPKS